MKKIFFLIFLFLGTACSSVELLPSTAAELMDEVNKFKGKKVVLINIWALWCIPCVEEFPMIVDLDKEIKDLEVIFVSADYEEQAESVKAFLKKNSVGPVSYIKKEKDEPFITGIHPKWSGSLPFTVVYAKESGNIVDSWEGSAPESRFRTAIKIAMNS